MGRKGRAGNRPNQARRGTGGGIIGNVRPNTYSALADNGQEDGTVNSDLTERFGRTRVSVRPDHSSAHDGSTTSRLTVPNFDVQAYFRPPATAITGGAWLQQPEFPLSPEVFHDKHTQATGDGTLVDVGQSVYPYKIEGPYENKERYLRTMYELLREDATRPLRDIIQQVREDPHRDEADFESTNIGIYDSVHIRALVFSNRGLATRISFSLNRVKKNIKWNQSKRLRAGTLVALTPYRDGFQSKCTLATVAARPVSALSQNPPEIDLFFAHPEEQEVDPMQEWIMVECRSSFFEATRHTLLALQHLMREPFSHEKYLVKLQQTIDVPTNIQTDPRIDLSSLVSVEEGSEFKNMDVLQQWPAMTSHPLDASQSRALKSMLTRELAIVQGPPGTGKTHVSVMSLRVLLDNMSPDDPPIIVTAQTNHAVDQMLRHIMEFEPNFVRLGGQSKDPNIKKRTVFELRLGMQSEEGQRRSYGGQGAGQARRSITQWTKSLQMTLVPMEANRPPLDHRLLLSLGLLTEKQVKSLVVESEGMMGFQPEEGEGILMEQWLGRNLVSSQRQLRPDDLDLFTEEEDQEVEQLLEAEAEAIQDDEDFDALRGPVILLSDNWRGICTDSMSAEDVRRLLQKTDDLTTIPVRNRGEIYNYLLHEVKRAVQAEVRQKGIEYAKAVQNRRIGTMTEDLQILSKARIIGCTTTGLSKYRAQLAALNPRVIMVEEAAETQEAPVTAACLPSLQQLILVGDHQQLRPHCQVLAFEDHPYYLNVSLFERLVNNKVAYDTLTRQRRMVPEVSRLLKPIYGKTLKDHASVNDLSNRPPIQGMGGNNSYFFTHEWPEERDNNMSVRNCLEGDMIVKFFDYLVLNGEDAKRITVLTFYNGQRIYIAHKLRDHRNFRTTQIKVVTVDSYQGEENDIILLSLVRSNNKQNIGFLSSKNRACVALSRARRGFYLFGHAELLAVKSNTWASVVKIMMGIKPKADLPMGQSRRIGYKFPLECKNHAKKTFIESPDDFDLIHAGCDEKCDGTLPCGHKCPYRCHPFTHDQMNCTQKCNQRLEACGHPCVAMCCDPHRCQVCEGREDGTKALLKPRGGAVYQSKRSNLSDTRTENNARYAPQSDAFVDHEPGIPEESWTSFASQGDVEAYDARTVQVRNEEGARFADTHSNYMDPGEHNSVRTASTASPTTPNLFSSAEPLISLSPERVPRSVGHEALIDIDGFTNQDVSEGKDLGAEKGQFGLLD